MKNADNVRSVSKVVIFTALVGVLVFVFISFIWVVPTQRSEVAPSTASAYINDFLETGSNYDPSGRYAEYVACVEDLAGRGLGDIEIIKQACSESSAGGTVDVWTRIGRFFTGVDAPIGTAKNIGIGVAALFGFGGIGAAYAAIRAYRRRRNSFFSRWS